MVIPCIIAPGGSYEKAEIALRYGADAVYVGCRDYSLRKSATNLTQHELKQLCHIAHSSHKKVYLAMNIFPHQSELTNIRSFLSDISKIQLDAIIVSDIGLASLIKSHTPFPIHASTQASILNSSTAKLWQSLGAKRVVLAREASLSEAEKIKALGIEVEVFIHGAMCSSFSGKCTISNVASGRDSNRGGCIQSCRHVYKLSNGDETHIMNSKDLMGIQQIPQFFNHQIDAVKIEGRMKSPLYVANACQVYRAAIDQYACDPNAFKNHQKMYETELKKISNRGFTDANLVKKANGASISYEWNGYTNSVQYAGIIKANHQNRSLVMAKHPITSGETFGAIMPKIKGITPLTIELESLYGKKIDRLMPNQHAWITSHVPLHSLLVV
jgi:putative protease